MREDNLLCVRRRAFVVTTDSRHNLPIYPNLAREITATAVNQLWVADITYIRLRTEFVYLAVILDAFSRRVIGWAAGPYAGGRTGRRGIAHGTDRAPTTARSGTPLRSRRAVCFPNLHRNAEATPRGHQHEPQGKPVRQRGLRILHENAKARRDLPQRIPRFPRGPSQHRRIPRACL